MYDGRDMTELATKPKKEWTQEELDFFHHSLQQMAPYLNQEGVSIHHEIIEEIKRRKRSGNQ